MSAQVPVPVGLDGWLRLPLSTEQNLKAGVYYIGYLLDKDQDCFSPGDGGSDASTDVYSTNGWPTPSTTWGAEEHGGTDIDAYGSVLPLL